jgi:hypothetical protein
VPGPNVRGRDDGIRRISRTTRWLAGIGLLVTGGFTALFAVQAGSSAANPQVSTPTATAPTTTPVTTPPVTAAPSAGTRVVPVPVTPAPIPVSPVPRVPIQPHTSSRGS